MAAAAEESRGRQINAVAWIFTGIAIVAVFLKLFARAQIVKRVGWDDFFIFLSLIFSIIAAAFVSYSVTLGLGRHTAAVIADHGMERLVMTAKWQILGFPFNIGSFSFPNISIAVLVIDLLDRDLIRARALYALVISQVTFAMVSVLLLLAQCKPVEKLWNPYIEGNCLDEHVFLYFSYWVSAYTALTDFVLAIVPITAFWKLQMRFSTKLKLCVLMGLTMFSAIVTIIKATHLHLFADKTDPLYIVVPLVEWGLVEQNVVLVAACIPTLRPFFHRAFGSHDTHTSTIEGRSNSGSAFKMLPVALHGSAKRLPSVSETRFNEPRPKGSGVRSNNSQKGICYGAEIRVDTDEEKNLGVDERRGDFQELQSP